MIVGGNTAANDIALSDAVPAYITFHTNALRKSHALGNLNIRFKTDSSSMLFWAWLPAMRIVPAIHWLKDMFQSDAPRGSKRRLSIFANPIYQSADLRDGLSTWPTWSLIFPRG